MLGIPLLPRWRPAGTVWLAGYLICCDDNVLIGRMVGLVEQIYRPAGTGCYVLHPTRGATKMASRWDAVVGWAFR